MKKLILILIITSLLAGCGILQEIKNIDDIKRENCNPCEGRHNK